MRPPICEVCNVRFDPNVEGGLLFFKKTRKGIEFNRKVAEEGFTGHPPDAGWFCGTHIEAAKKLSNLTINQALSVLRTRFGSIQR